MENYLVIFVLFLAVIGIFVFQLYQKKTEVRNELADFKKVYYLKNSLLDKYERAFYESLKKQLPVNLTIFTKVRIEDFIGVRKNIKEHLKFRGYVKSRHLDFIVCDERMKPVLAIELDGSSHKSKKTIETDERKNQICEAVGLKLERIKVGSDYDAESLRIRNLLVMPESPLSDN